MSDKVWVPHKDLVYVPGSQLEESAQDRTFKLENGETLVEH